MKKILKKVTCGALAALCVFGSAATLTACESSNPEVEIEISFQGESYTLAYKLYRKTAPATVEHFMYLADNGYYDGLCVHEYSTTAMYTGAYSVVESDPTALVYKRYFEELASFEDYEDFPHSVWMDREQTSPSYTLVGEFSDNHFTVESGALKQSFGSLSMYYFDIANSSVKETNVYTPYNKKDGMRSVDYQYNCATSMFAVSLSTEEKSNSKYCTFATLKGKSEDDLEDLLAAIEEYAGEDEFTQSVNKKIFEDDPLMKDVKATKDFNVPKAPIVITKVEITKY